MRIRRLVPILVLFGTCLTGPAAALAQSRTVFEGRPSVKVSEGGIERTPETLTTEKATSLHCVISEIGGQFYSASRGNVLLTVHDSEAFTTYTATNGSGYVRVIQAG